MIPHETIKHHLNSLIENDLSKQVLVPLLVNMGYREVLFIGGPGERGMDIHYWEAATQAGRVYTGVQVKLGDIKYSSRSVSQTIKDLISQAEEAFIKPIDDFNLNKKWHIGSYLIIATGEITEDAKETIRQAKRRYPLHANIHFWSWTQICDNINQYWVREFQEKFNIKVEDVPEANTKMPEAPKQPDGQTFSLGGTNAIPSILPIALDIETEEESFPDSEYFELNFPELVDAVTTVRGSCSPRAWSVLVFMALERVDSMRSSVTYGELTRVMKTSWENLEFELRELSQLAYTHHDGYEPEMCLDGMAVAISKLCQAIFEHGITETADQKFMLNKLSINI